MNIIIASNNKNKIKEFKQILEPLQYNVLSQSEAGINLEVEENGTTFEQNAQLKADAIYKLKHTSVISDDGGLEVDYLNGEPGIYSARYKGLETAKQRNEYILNAMKNVPIEHRTARFICCICYIKENGEKIIVKGIIEGTIAEKECGNNDFGYDPIFIPNNEKRTFAQMSNDEKNKISHRCLAIEKLKKYFN